MLEKRNYDFDPGSVLMRQARIGVGRIPIPTPKTASCYRLERRKCPKIAVYLGESLGTVWRHCSCRSGG